jgi:hypothetical protein
MAMNHFIADALDDKVFFYARKVDQGPDMNWDIHVDPNACLVSMEDMDNALPTVETLRQGALNKQIVRNGIFYKGQVLFSGGVVLTINEKFLLLLRDAQAPVDPLKWTSPAGRCDREPLFTSLKEFYEEVIIFDRISGHPVFVSFPEKTYCRASKGIYSRTLKRKGFDQREAQWTVVNARADNKYIEHLRTVQTFFGSGQESGPSVDGEVFKARFFTFFDEIANTLELRLLASLSVPSEMETRLAFRDGEYERSVRLFSIEDLMHLEDASLVGTMVHFRDTVLQSRTPENQVR